MEEHKDELKRGLKARHIELIALGGTIGVGLFMGSSTTITLAGPSVLLAYILAGIVLFIVMRVMGEMLYFEPVAGSFSSYAHEYISPAMGYLTAWSYWFLWVAVGMSEVTAIGVYTHYWFPDLPQWIPALCGVTFVALANLATIKYYGEIEFWFAIAKVATIVVMLIVGFAMIFFGIGNEGIPIGMSNLYAHGGFFTGGLKGFLFALCLVTASYQGGELVGITAGEAEDPQTTLVKAIKNVLWRILIFYVGAMFVVLCLYPWNQIGTLGSPFVLTFSKVGITAAAGLINFVVLTAALSGCNSGIYSASRMLYALGEKKQLPPFFAKISKSGVPYNAVNFSILLLFVGALLNYLIPDSKLFVYIYSASVFPGMIAWLVLLFAQFKFRKKWKSEMGKHPFKSPLFPYANYFAVIFLTAVTIGMVINEDTRISLLVGAGFCLFIYISFFFKKSSR